MPPGPSDSIPVLMRRHLVFGWWSLLVFLCLGGFLETLHGVKSLAYLDVANEMRRLMWRLAHAHGALLSLVHVAFAATLGVLPKEADTGAPALRRLRLAARSFTASLLLIPGGFFAAGAVLVRGEPNPAVLLVPVGAAFLLIAAALTGYTAKELLERR